MSWEVSSMPSKRSFFNRTLFLKNLGRFWPLWGGVSLAGAMLPLYLLLAMLQRQIHWVEPLEFAEGLSAAAAYLVPAFTCGYAILCAMAVWGYLCNSRSAGMMHALPVDRTCLFVTGVLSGLAMILIPYAVTGGLLCLIALFCGAFHLTAVVTTVLTVAFAAVLFFGMATLCAMLTGHALVLPVFYLLANFLAHLMEMLVTGLAEDFLLGVWMTQDMGMLGFLSPVMQIYRSVRPVAERLPDGTLTGWRLQGLWVLGLYALAGLALLALAWYLYRRRHSESAGDVVAFRWLRPVFRYGLALLSGLTAGRLLYELFWRSLFQRGAYAERRPMMVCVFLGGMLGYYIASMLLEKSLRVFRGSWRGAALVAAGAAALCLLVSIDLFGVERRVPEPEEIESVTLLDRGGAERPLHDGGRAGDCGAAGAAPSGHRGRPGLYPHLPAQLGQRRGAGLQPHPAPDLPPEKRENCGAVLRSVAGGRPGGNAGDLRQPAGGVLQRPGGDSGEREHPRRRPAGGH